MHWQDVTVETKEGTLFVRIWQPPKPNGTPEKSPIVLFHDSLGCVDVWRNFPAALSTATHRTVIAYDRLGYGKSSPNPHRQSLDFVGKEVEIYFPALHRQLNLAGFVAFGHSVGGAMAIQCACRFADICEALITEGAQVFVEDRTLDSIRAAKSEFARTGDVERLKKYHGDKARWVLDAWTETWLTPEFSLLDVEKCLPQVRCPTLAIHGSEDEYGTTRHPQLICELTGDKARMKILPNCGHVPHREQEQEILKTVTDFLEVVPS